MDLDDLLNAFNVIEWAHGFVWSFTAWLPRRRSHKGRKVGRLRVDAGVRQIEIDRRIHSGWQAECILRKAHIPIAGRRITGKGAHFLVYERQYQWALYVLLREGVVVRSPVPADVARWACQHDGPVPIWGTDGYAAIKAQNEALERNGKPQATNRKRQTRPADRQAGLEQSIINRIKGGAPCKTPKHKIKRVTQHSSLTRLLRRL